MSDVVLTRENERQLVFANRPEAAFAVGLAFAIAGYVVYSVVPDRRRWFLLAVALVAVAISVAAMLRRQRLVLDIADRRYVRETGYWPRPARQTGSLAEIEHLELRLRLRSRGLLPLASRRQQRLWVVSLKFRGDREPYVLFEERREARAYARVESLAQKLRVPTVDRTGAQDRVTPWEEIAKPLAARLPGEGNAPAAVPPPPLASGIRFHDVPGRRYIELPAHGFTYWVPGLYVLPAALAAIGMMFARFSAERAATGGLLLGALLLLAGLGLAFVLSAAVFGHEWIAENRERLVIGNRLAGITWRRRRIPKRDLREIDIRTVQPVGAPAPPATEERGAGAVAQPMYQEVVLRSTSLLRRFGAHLSAAERKWLRDALTAMAR